jgi:hypothetical protein
MLNCLFLIIGELKPWEYCRCISKYILTQELLLNIQQNDILIFLDSHTGLDRGFFLSRIGNCKTFDDKADGYCRAEGVGTIIIVSQQVTLLLSLKPFSGYWKHDYLFVLPGKNTLY